MGTTDGRKEYFEAALSDFVFDVAAGGAIRHLTDRGYSVEQIMRELSYPVPRDRVEKAVYRHLTESRILKSADKSLAGRKITAFRRKAATGRYGIRRGELLFGMPLRDMEEKG